MTTSEPLTLFPTDTSTSSMAASPARTSAPPAAVPVSRGRGRGYSGRRSKPSPLFDPAPILLENVPVAEWIGRRIVAVLGERHADGSPCPRDDGEACSFCDAVPLFA